jgi:benzodiazapine receptor
MVRDRLSSNEVSPSNAERHSPSRVRQALALIGSIALCFGAAGLGSLATATSVGEWYQALSKPSWTPPSWLFGPVWSALYLLMAIAAWLIWRRESMREARVPLGWFGVQLTLNVGWSVLFFGMRQPGLAFGEIVALWLAIVVTAVTFWKRSRIAAMLLAPYLAWTSFAVLLNYTIWRMNCVLSCHISLSLFNWPWSHDAN